MGCATTRTVYIPNRINGKKRLSLELQKKKYITNHERFDNLILNKEMKNDFENRINTDFDQFFNSFYSKWKLKLDEAKLTKEDARDVVVEKVVEELMADVLSYKDWDVRDLIMERIEHLKDLKDEKMDIAKTILNSSAPRIYPNIQRGPVINCSEKTAKWGLKHFFTNLKCNASFQSQVLNIIITPSMFEDEENIFDFCEVIDSNPNLITVSIVISKGTEYSDTAYIPEHSHLLSLKYIFETLKYNTSVKAFAFMNYSEYLYTLPNETYSSLIGLLKIDKFNSICLSKHNFTNDNVKNFMHIFENSTHMKFLIFDNKYVSTECNDLFISSVIKNRALNGVLWGSAEYNDDLDELDQKIKSQNPSIKFFHFEKHFKILD
jgi:hypothetical protein